MRLFGMVPVAAAVLLATGCGKLVSVEPLATEENVTFDSSLIGVWTDDDETTYTVRDGGSQSYDIDVVMNGKPSENVELKGRLVQLGQQRVLDLCARKGAPFSVKGHAFVRVRPTSDGLEVRFIGSDSLQEQILQSQSPAHIVVEEHPVITASSEELQTFLRTFGLSEAGLEEAAVLHRSQVDMMR